MIKNYQTMDKIFSNLQYNWGFGSEVVDREGVRASPSLKNCHNNPKHSLDFFSEKTASVLGILASPFEQSKRLRF